MPKPLTCKRCGHTWTPRVTRPKRCASPHCKSAYWDRDRVYAEYDHWNAKPKDTRTMREDLKERMRKLFHDNPVHVFHVLLDYWTGESVYIWDVGSTWIFGLGRTPWPDSRVESFLDAAETFREKWP